MQKRYIVFPGRVPSRNDGQWHYIDAPSLMRLYRVRPEECMVVRGEAALLGLPKGLIPLVPRYDGNYELPE